MLARGGSTASVVGEEGCRTVPARLAVQRYPPAPPAFPLTAWICNTICPSYLSPSLTNLQRRSSSLMIIVAKGSRTGSTVRCQRTSPSPPHAVNNGSSGHPWTSTAQEPCKGQDSDCLSGLDRCVLIITTKAATRPCPGREMWWAISDFPASGGRWVRERSRTHARTPPTTTP